MKKIWVVQYNDGTADVWDEDKGSPSCPYVDAFAADDTIKDLHSDYAALLARVARLENAGKSILRKIPATKNDYSGVGYCFGCGVVKWASGQGSYSEECKPDCALQAFRRALEEK